MSALSIKPLVERLHGAGLSLTLAPEGGLSVTPSSRLNDNLRALIRSRKAYLLLWLTETPANEPPTDPAQWRELAAAYHDHHFCCRTCIAAGQGVALRCGVGTALWRAYANSVKTTAT
jgi:hypothetical protein